MGPCGSTHKAAAPACQEPPAVAGAWKCAAGCPEPAFWEGGSALDASRVVNCEKQVRASGNAPGRLGVACRRGMKKDDVQPNQDAWCARFDADRLEAFGVFDGHGDKGHLVSHFARETLTKVVAEAAVSREDPSEDVQHCYALVHRALCESAQLGTRLSGTTATVVVHDVDRSRLVVSHVGDSGAVLLRRTDEGGLVAKRLTQDHVPELAAEKARIEECGGRVVFDGRCHRVLRHGCSSGLNMSRSLGDASAHEAGVSAEPDIRQTLLGPEDMAVLVASDGIWQVITPQQAAGIVARFPADSAMEAAGALADEAVRRWFARSQGQVIDDVTVVIAYLARRSRAPSEDLASTMSLLSSPCSEVSGPSDGTSAPPTPAA